MDYLIYIFIFIFGTIFGSFYGVVGTRLCEDKSIIKPGSCCPNCNHGLKWYDLIPVISYVMTLGKCRYCHKPISFFYPFIEISTGILFCVSYGLYGPHISYNLIISLFLFSLIVIIFITDFNYYTILDSPLVISSIVVFIAKWAYFGIKPALFGILSGLILFLAMIFVKKVGDLLFKKESLGGGDIKLAFVVGLVLGVKLGLSALILSTFIALPYSLMKVYLSEKKEVPFGPFIIGACTIVFLFMPKFINLLNYLFN